MHLLLRGVDGCEREDRVPLDFGRGEITSRLCKLGSVNPIHVRLAKLPSRLIHETNRPRPRPG